MSLPNIEELPDDARLWCFAAEPPPSREASARLLVAVEAFVEEWMAHGQALRAALEWRRGRFLLIAVDESAAGASGCSIDALTHRLREIESDLGLRLLDASPIWFLEPGSSEAVRCVTRPEFRELARTGRVDGDTRVFDLTAGRLADVRRGRFERPAGEAWHARLLSKSAAQPATAPGARPPGS